jgi:hypothetical protein
MTVFVPFEDKNVLFESGAQQDSCRRRQEALAPSMERYEPPDARL